MLGENTVRARYGRGTRRASMAADLVFPPAAQPDIIRALQKDVVYVRVSAGCRLIFCIFWALSSDARCAGSEPRPGTTPPGTQLQRWRLHIAAHSPALDSLVSERDPLGWLGSLLKSRLARFFPPALLFRHRRGLGSYTPRR